MQNRLLRLYLTTILVAMLPFMLLYLSFIDWNPSLRPTGPAACRGSTRDCKCAQSDSHLIELAKPRGAKKGGTFKGNHWFHMAEYYISRSQHFHLPPRWAKPSHILISLLIIMLRSEENSCKLLGLTWWSYLQSTRWAILSARWGCFWWSWPLLMVRPDEFNSLHTHRFSPQQDIMIETRASSSRRDLYSHMTVRGWTLFLERLPVIVPAFAA